MATNVAKKSVAKKQVKAGKTTGKQLMKGNTAKFTPKKMDSKTIAKPRKLNTKMGYQN